MHTLLALAAVFTLIAAAGCTPVHWRKPGATEAEAARDIAECRTRARDESFREIHSRLLAHPYGTLDRYGHATLAPPLSAEGERIGIEESLVRNCMRRLGYVLQQDVSR